MYYSLQKCIVTCFNGIDKIAHFIVLYTKPFYVLSMLACFKKVCDIYNLWHSPTNEVQIKNIYLLLKNSDWEPKCIFALR